ncbi:DUF418 domain-containing protein [Fodinicola acaciae]|uniref:DUF418 domain-containing protein n=1 Tax=Fodinicola acaciae TaxID=2681555 RepID=UPI0013D66365|nr:DUF418 domain-containing protein [Fodinicola acaciae]
MAHSQTPAARERIAALDVIRGFALCGILVANVIPIAHTGPPQAVDPGSGNGNPLQDLFVDHRFFPIFAFLFGVGFALLLDSAGNRTPRPRLVLLRRLAVLLVAGLAHFFLLWQGDILSTYAVVGIVVLLPASWLPRWLTGCLSGAFLVAAVLLSDGRFTLVAALFLLGLTLVRYGVIARIEDSTGVPALLLLVFTVLAVPAVWLQLNVSSFTFSSSLAGLLTAGAYVCGLLVLLRTPLQGALRTLFAPLGRMALTNYLTATVLVLVLSRVIPGRPDDWPFGKVLLVAVAILATQWLWSTLWLRHFRFGPLEWLWRWATWLRRPPLQLPAVPRRGAPARTP